MEPGREHRDVERRSAGTTSSPSRRSTAASSPHDTVKGSPGAGAAVRVLGRVRRLRRDAVPQARQPAVRRPDDRGQRHGLLVDLRRQPADHAVDRQRARAAARPGPTRCSRTTPSSAWACAWRSTRRPATPATLLERLAPVVGEALVRELLDSRRRTPSPSIAAQRERVERLRDALERVDRRPRPRTPDSSSPSPATSSARASGSSAATAGPTTSASAAWTRS